MAIENTLQRFVTAQEKDYDRALAEIKNGRKVSHWMWYIFPQLQGLGFSDAAYFYGIAGSAEAAAYLSHPVLGGRLIAISEALLGLKSSSATVVMGSPDDLKLRSSMTLFAALPNAPLVFAQVLDKYFEGVRDEKTARMLGGE